MFSTSLTKKKEVTDFIAEHTGYGNFLDWEKLEWVGFSCCVILIPGYNCAQFLQMCL